MNLKKMEVKARHLAHLIMCVFAGASLFNISEFIYTLHHNTATAWTVAIALAASLVVFSALLSGMKWRSTGFYITLAVVAGLTAISGSIQGGAYSAAIGWPGWLMGFAMPLFGELGASLALSIYTKEQQARSMDEAQRQLSDGVRQNIIEALGNVDKSRIEAQVNRAIGVITKELIDSTIHDMLAELCANRPAIMEIEAKPIAEMTPLLAKTEVNLPAQIESKSETNPILTSISDDEPTEIERMNAGKQRKIEVRRSNMLEILKSTTPTVAELASQLEASENTIRKDLTALQTQGFAIAVNGIVKLS